MILDIENPVEKPIRSYIGNDLVWQDLVYTPTDLFANGEQGVWFDPSDLSTMFQDEYGTMPVTKDGDPVGLILDKSQSLEFSNPVYVQKESNFSFQITSNTSNHINISEPMPQGFYKITLNFVSLSASYIRIRRGNRDSHILLSDSSPSALSYEFNGYFEGGEQLNYQDLNRNTEAVLGSIKIENILGNHARQTLAASRPIYRTDGSLHWLEFDGVDDQLSTSKNFTINTPLTMFTRMDPDMSGGIAAVFSLTFNHVNTVSIQASAGNTRAYVRIFGETGIFTPSHTTEAATTVLQVSSGKVSLNTGSGSMNLDTDFTTQYAEGAAIDIGKSTSTSTVPFNGVFYGGVYVADALGDKDIKGCVDYLDKKSGVTL